VSGTSQQCTNPSCTQGALGLYNQAGQVVLDSPLVDYSVPIDVSDHTGTLHTRLTGPVLEGMMGLKVWSFILCSKSTLFFLCFEVRDCSVVKPKLTFAMDIMRIKLYTAV